MNFKRLYLILLQYVEDRKKYKEAFINEVSEMLAHMLGVHESSINKKDIRELHCDSFGVKYWINDDEKIEIKFHMSIEEVEIAINDNSLYFDFKI